MNDVQPKLLLVRAREGLVGNVRRSCHVVIVPDGGALPEFLIACCGVQFTPGSAELLDQISGIPCEACLAKAPLPNQPLLESSQVGSGEERAP